jgi:hypothetical protein
MTDTKLHALDISRRGFIRRAGVIAGVGALVGVGLAASPAVAGSKFSQSMAKYQTTPKGAQRCDNCTQFQPAAACKVVDGTIDPGGWCFLYAHKAG